VGDGQPESPFAFILVKQDGQNLATFRLSTFRILHLNRYQKLHRASAAKLLGPGEISVSFAILMPLSSWLFERFVGSLLDVTPVILESLDQ
jgi:hypothetical protein